ncbi:MAG: hypothetical protein LBJ62_09690 [Bifidobacteriaceae bacterium]|jgi:hypothetical protein|nr:hypothetical protein [Bifidobacteriaceae bacterium]
MAFLAARRVRVQAATLTIAALALAGFGVFGAAPAAQAEIVVDTCPPGMACYANDSHVVSDHTLSGDYSWDIEGNLIVEPGVRLTIGQGTGTWQGGHLINYGTIEAQGIITLDATLVNHGSMVILGSFTQTNSFQNDGQLNVRGVMSLQLRGMQASNSGQIVIGSSGGGGSLSVNNGELSNSGDFSILPGGQYSSYKGPLRNTGNLLNQGTMWFTEREAADPAYGLENNGTVDNTSGYIKFADAKATGNGTWDGTAEHSPLYFFNLISSVPAEAGNGQLTNCMPRITSPSTFGPWSQYTEYPTNSQISAFIHEGLRLEITVPAECQTTTGKTAEFTSWSMSGDTDLIPPPTITTPFSITMPGYTFVLFAGYAIQADSVTPPPTPTPTPSSSLAPTGPAAGQIWSQAGGAGLLVVLGGILLAAAARRRLKIAQTS